MEPTEIPIDAYFRRPTTAIGVSAMEQISLMHVLVVGLRGCGMEIAKCLVLSGVQRLTLMDDERVRDDDLSVGFLLRDGDQGKPKAKLVASRLNEHAPFADVRTLTGTLSLDLLLNFHVVVFASTSVSQEEITAYDEFCRAQDQPIGVVVVESRGLFGSVFTDFSNPLHSVNTTPGNADVAFTVANKRTQVHTDGLVDVFTVAVKEPLLNVLVEPGDHMTLHETNANNEPLMVVVEEVISDRSVRLRPVDDAKITRNEMQSRLYGPFTMLQRVGSRLSTATHRSLRECLLFPGLIAAPVSPQADDICGRSRSLHMASIAIHEFRREFGVSPSNNNADHIKHMLALIDEFFSKNAACQRPEESDALALQRDDVDIVLIARALRCASCELLPLSALIAGHAALQVLKFSGALGPLLHPDSQFQYFDVIDLADEGPSDSSTVPAPHAPSLTALFGSEVVARLQHSNVAVVGVGSVNVEVLKNLKCCGIELNCVRLVLDPDENPTIQADDLHDSVLFTPAVIGHSKIAVLQAFDQSIRVEAPAIHGDFTTLPCETWTDSNVIVAEVSYTQSRLAIDEASRTYEKPMLVTYEDTCGLLRTDIVVPHSTATFSERLLPPAYKNVPTIFPFDHIPTPSRPGAGGHDRRELLPSERIVQNAQRCFEMMFKTTVLVATQYAKGRCLSSVSEANDNNADDDESTLWMLWSVMQRGHGVGDFSDCLRVAWLLLELLPRWMTSSRSASKSTTTTTRDVNPLSESDDEDPQHENSSSAILELNPNEPDHGQLLVATACIVAASVQVAVPPVESRRVLLTQVIADSSNFSLHCKPRTPSSIRASFKGIDASHVQAIVGRVSETTLDLDDISKGHLHFLQALGNVQLAWREHSQVPEGNGEHSGLSRIATLPDLRRLCRDKCGFLPVTTIIGGLKTLQFIHILVSSIGVQKPLHELCEYGANATTTTRRAVPIVLHPPPPLFAKSMTYERTRGTRLRVIPEECTRWTKIVVPASAALQSVKAVVQFVETKFQVTVHAIAHRGHCVATINTPAMAATEGLLTQSVFDLCGSSAPFVLLDVVAVDIQGDVAMAPLRVHRKA